MGDEFWDSEKPPRHHKADAGEERLLTRDEVFVPEIYGGFLGEWKRDQAYFQYLILRGGVSRLPKRYIVAGLWVIAFCIAVAVIGTYLQAP